jgi:hypothetical protein
MKSRIIKAILFFAIIVLVYFLFTMFYGSPKDNENINEETNLEESNLENTTSNTNNNSFFSEEEKEAKLQACIIALLGPERILELESGNGKITPAVESKIKECEEKINKGEF